jgi:integrase
VRSDGDESFEMSSLELLRQAIVHGDQDAWAGFRQCLEEIVLTWLYEHPNREVVCRGLCEKHLVAQAFERFRQVAVRRQMAFETLARVLVYLRASLQGAILDTLRTLSTPGAVSRPVPDQVGEPGVEDPIDSNEFWEALQTQLLSAREQRLVYLLYHCGLRPREILRGLPQEWSDVQEIYCLRRKIVGRLLHHADAMRS